VTRSGQFLRRTSLDELPQLWNVLRGEMSLVGPRPIVHAEIPKYGNAFDLYTKAKGGLTGLWQVSGRNDTSYAERVSLDTFYVRNWSVWLDLYILFRTTETLLFRRGAY
jgi:lipopolysaccharide/colanic/teichoic acid biosynthesis glycosyltransferase